MEFRCRPCNSVTFFLIVGILFLTCPVAFAQCKGNFSYQSVSSAKDAPSGKIEVTVQQPEYGTYTFKVFEMNGTARLVQTKQVSGPDKISFEGLKPATYFIKVEWGESCYRTLGGLEGITVTQTDPRR